MKSFRRFIEEQEQKELILMRGVSGSGKSTIARNYASNHGGVIFSTDDFFMQDGKYVFDPKKIGEYHQMNHMRAEEAMKQGVTPIIIDNTNTQAWEMKDYVLMAKKYGYTVSIKQPGDVDFPEADFDEIMKRQQLRKDSGKSIPPEIVQRMLDRFQKNVSVDDIVNSKKPF